LEIANFLIRRGFGLDSNEPAKVVVDVFEGGVNRLYPIDDQLSFPNYLTAEIRDFADSVFVQ